MGITIKTPDTTQLVKGLSIDPPLLARELEFEKTDIKFRTERGRSVSGAAFPAYSKRYAAWKQGETGRTEIDLTLSGRMLKSLQTKAWRESPSKTIGKIFLTFRQDVARKHQSGDGVPKRRFMGLSKEQIARLRKNIKARILRVK